MGEHGSNIEERFAKQASHGVKSIHLRSNREEDNIGRNMAEEKPSMFATMAQSIGEVNTNIKPSSSEELSCHISSNGPITRGEDTNIKPSMAEDVSCHISSNGPSTSGEDTNIKPSLAEEVSFHISSNGPITRGEDTNIKPSMAEEVSFHISSNGPSTSGEDTNIKPSMAEEVSCHISSNGPSISGEDTNNKPSMAEEVSCHISSNGPSISREDTDIKPSMAEEVSCHISSNGPSTSGEDTNIGKPSIELKTTLHETTNIFPKMIKKEADIGPENKKEDETQDVSYNMHSCIDPCLMDMKTNNHTDNAHQFKRQHPQITYSQSELMDLRNNSSSLTDFHIFCLHRWLPANLLKPEAVKDAKKQTPDLEFKKWTKGILDHAGTVSAISEVIEPLKRNLTELFKAQDYQAQPLDHLTRRYYSMLKVIDPVRCHDEGGEGVLKSFIQTYLDTFVVYSIDAKTYCRMTERQHDVGQGDESVQRKQDVVIDQLRQKNCKALNPELKDISDTPALPHGYEYRLSSVNSEELCHLKEQLKEKVCDYLEPRSQPVFVSTLCHLPEFGPLKEIIGMVSGKRFKFGKYLVDECNDVFQFTRINGTLHTVSLRKKISSSKANRPSDVMEQYSLHSPDREEENTHATDPSQMNIEDNSSDSSHLVSSSDVESEKENSGMGSQTPVSGKDIIESLFSPSSDVRTTLEQDQQNVIHTVSSLVASTECLTGEILVSSKQGRTTGDGISSNSSENIAADQQLFDELNLLRKACEVLKRHGGPLPIGHLSSDSQVHNLIKRIHNISNKPFNWLSFLKRCSDTLDLTMDTRKQWCVSLKVFENCQPSNNVSEHQQTSNSSNNCLQNGTESPSSVAIEKESSSLSTGICVDEQLKKELIELLTLGKQSKCGVKEASQLPNVKELLLLFNSELFSIAGSSAVLLSFLSSNEDVFKLDLENPGQVLFRLQGVGDSRLNTKKHVEDAGDISVPCDKQESLAKVHFQGKDEIKSQAFSLSPKKTPVSSKRDELHDLKVKLRHKLYELLKTQTEPIGVGSFCEQPSLQILKESIKKALESDGKKFKFGRFLVENYSDVLCFTWKTNSLHTIALKKNAISNECPKKTSQTLSSQVNKGNGPSFSSPGITHSVFDSDKSSLCEDSDTGISKMSLYHSQEPRVAEAGSISSLSSFSSDVVSAEESTRIHDGSSYEEEPTSSISEQEQDTSDDISSVSSHSITTVPRLSPDELKLLSRVCHLLRKRNEPLPIGHIGNDPELQELICKIHVTTFDSAEPFKWKTFLGKCNDTLDLSQRTLKGTQEWCVSLKECHKKRCPSTTSRLTDNSLDAHTSKDSNITEHAPVKLSKNQLRKLDSSLRNRLLSYLQTNSGEHALRDIVNQKCILKGVQVMNSLLKPSSTEFSWEAFLHRNKYMFKVIGNYDNIMNCKVSLSPEFRPLDKPKGQPQGSRPSNEVQSKDSTVMISKTKLRKLDVKLRNRLLEYLQESPGGNVLKYIVKCKCIKEEVQELNTLLKPYSTQLNWETFLERNKYIFHVRGSDSDIMSCTISLKSQSQQREELSQGFASAKEICLSQYESCLLQKVLSFLHKAGTGEHPLKKVEECKPVRQALENLRADLRKSGRQFDWVTFLAIARKVSSVNVSCLETKDELKIRLSAKPKDPNVDNLPTQSKVNGAPNSKVTELCAEALNAANLYSSVDTSEPSTIDVNGTTKSVVAGRTSTGIIHNEIIQDCPANVCSSLHRIPKANIDECDDAVAFGNIVGMEVLAASVGRASSDGKMTIPPTEPWSEAWSSCSISENKETAKLTNNYDATIYGTSSGQLLPCTKNNGEACNGDDGESPQDTLEDRNAARSGSRYETVEGSKRACKKPSSPEETCKEIYSPKEMSKEASLPEELFKEISSTEKGCQETSSTKEVFKETSSTEEASKETTSTDKVCKVISSSDKVCKEISPPLLCAVTPTSLPWGEVHHVNSPKERLAALLYDTFEDSNGFLLKAQTVFRSLGLADVHIEPRTVANVYFCIVWIGDSQITSTADESLETAKNKALTKCVRFLMGMYH
ncbi:uncharacterized protein LOC5515399 [Nematostella vectensis]|uniref:uncharacterized protein LOC5515399 n=1 Tax=Nematostella vectensis TaxID=45351 RepID=UPI0020774918|nr:uncharacterized protein LOC5515399 [Nematostella vectensis]